MKNTKLLSKTTKIIAAIILLASMAFIASNNSISETSEKKINFKNGLNYETKKYNMHSIAIRNGKYKIDTGIVVQNLNKKTLIDQLNTENIYEKKSVSEIPDFIKAFLDSVSGNRNFEMANPKEQWRWAGITEFGDKSRANLPDKQLIYFGNGSSIALLSYYSGGLNLTQRIAIIKFENNKIIDFWFDNYLAYLWSDNTQVLMQTKTEIIKYLNIQRKNSAGC